MKAPEGMKWIDVTYTARRIEARFGTGTSGVFEGEAGMRILVDRDVAKYLSKACDWAAPLPDGSLSTLERILRAREELCRGKYVEGSIKDIRIMEDDDE